MSITASNLRDLIDPSDFPQKLMMGSESGNLINFNPEALDEACNVLENENASWYWEISDFTNIYLHVQFHDVVIESEIGEYYNVGDLDILLNFYFKNSEGDRNKYKLIMEMARTTSVEANMFSVQGKYHPHADGPGGRMCFGETGTATVYSDLRNGAVKPEQLSHFLFELGSWVAYESSSTGPYINFNDEVSKLVSNSSSTPKYNDSPVNMREEVRKFIIEVVKNWNTYSRRKTTISKLFFVQRNYEYISKIFIQYLEGLSNTKKAILKGNNVLVQGIQRSDGTRSFVQDEHIDVSHIMGQKLYFSRKNGKAEPPRMTMDIRNQLTTLIHPKLYEDIKFVSQEIFREAIESKQADPLDAYKEKIEQVSDKLETLHNQIIETLQQNQMEPA